MAMNIEIRTDKEIILFDEDSQNRVVIRPYRRNERMWLAIEAPQTIRIDHITQGASGNGDRETN